MIVRTKQEGSLSAETAPPSDGSRERGSRHTYGPPKRGPWLKRAFIAFGILVGIAVFYGAYSLWESAVATPGMLLVYHTVKRGELAITVTERGNLESQSDVEVFCEVDDISGDGINGTPIIGIVENGSSVTEGDLLVELDSAPHLERLDRQILDTERAIAAKIQAEAKHDNQKSQNEMNEANAELDVKLAELELEMFNDEEKGTYRLDIDAVERQIEDINNEILAALSSMELKKNEKIGLEALFKLGYAGKRQLDQSVLDHLQAESQYAAKMNKLNTELASLDNKQTYVREMQILQLEGSLATATRKLDQVVINNRAQLAQTESALRAASESLKKEQELLDRYREQLRYCEIFAPQDGMVAYAISHSRYSQEEIREGATVRPRQKILSLPNLSIMQVKTSVHESVLDQIRTELRAIIRVDAFPDRVYQGTVKSVAVLPDQGGWFSPDTKVYKTIVTIDEEVERLKPGMTAVVEIDVDRLRGVLTVPIQSIVQVAKQTYCFVDVGGTPERRTVKLGRTNDKFIQVTEGLSEGDRVVLNPMAIVDESEEGDTVEQEEEKE